MSLGNDHTPAPIPDVTDDHLRDQLIVDAKHLDTVCRMLRSLGIHWADRTTADDDADLGLGRLTGLTDDEGITQDVGELLALVRQRSAAERDGWTPVMGKNRIMDGVIGEGLKPHSVAGLPILEIPGADFLDGDVGGEGLKPHSGYDPEPAQITDLLTDLKGEPGAGSGVRVGVIDTPRHPERPADGDPWPFRAGHGGFVANIIEQQAPDAEVQVEGLLVGERARADSWTAAQAILRMARDGVDILNLSLGCYTLSGGPPLVIARAIERIPAGVLVVAAAGNHGAFAHVNRGRDRLSASWPAALPGVVAVGAVKAGGEAADFSPQRSWVTCTALGVDVVARYLTGRVQLRDLSLKEFQGYARWSGTSFSAAIVSGAVAARTVPGKVSAQEAFDALLTHGPLIKPFTSGPQTG